MVRLGYEVATVDPLRRMKFKKRSTSSLAWDNHRREHTATLTFKQKSEGWISKEYYLEVEIGFSDWDISVSDDASRHWQEIADKIQVMLSDPAFFLPLQAPPPFAPPRPPLLAATEPTPRGTTRHPVAQGGAAAAAPGDYVYVRWTDGNTYAGRVSSVAWPQCRVALVSGGVVDVPVASLSPRADIAVPSSRGPALPAPSRQIERHVVERQVVVIRCKFCRKLTPVDHATCEHCGAPGFGS